MSSRFWLFPLTMLLAGCATPAAPLEAASPSPTATLTPAALAPSAKPTSTPIPVPTPTFTPMPAASPAGYVFISSGGHTTPPVGSTITLTLQSDDDRSVLPGATWLLQPDQAARARLTPSANGASCALEVLQPGAIHVTATLGNVAGQIVLGAIASPKPASPVAVDQDLDGGVAHYLNFDELPDTVTLVNTLDDWTRLWRGIAAYSAETAGPSKEPNPPPPAVDLTTESLVVMTLHNAPVGDVPVITDVDARGRVSLVLAFEDNGEPVTTDNHPTIAMFKLPKLPTTAYVDFSCRLNGSSCASPLPSR